MNDEKFSTSGLSWSVFCCIFDSCDRQARTKDRLAINRNAFSAGSSSSHSDRIPCVVMAPRAFDRVVIFLDHRVTAVPGPKESKRLEDTSRNKTISFTKKLNKSGDRQKDKGHVPFRRRKRSHEVSQCAFPFF